MFDLPLFDLLGPGAIVAYAVVNILLNAVVMYLVVNFLVAERGTATFWRCILCVFGLTVSAVIAGFLMMIPIPIGNWFLGIIAFYFLAKICIESFFEMIQGVHRTLFAYIFFSIVLGYAIQKYFIESGAL